MDIRPLTETYSVTPQIAPEDIAAIAEAGFQTVICNRPDGEIPPELHLSTLRPALEAAGLTVIENPMAGGGLTMEHIDTQRAAIDAATASGGKVLAYCASGNRSSILYALAMAGRAPTDDLIEAGARYGYQVPQFRDLIEKLAGSNS